MNEAIAPANKMDIGAGKERVSVKMRNTLTLMAETGVSLKHAANKAGMAEESALKAFRRPHIKRLFKQMVEEVRENAAQLAYLRLNHMSQTAASEHVKADTNKWVAGVDGISPVQKVQGQHHHTVEFGGFTYDDVDTIDHAAPDTKSEDQQSQAIDKAVEK